MLKSKIKTEVHTHTNASFHAYSTIGEMIAMSEKKGIELLAITDHGPSQPDSPSGWYFANFSALPRKVGTVYVVRGVEVNFLDYDGTVDMNQDMLKGLDWVIAGIHSPYLAPGSIDDITQMYIKAFENPLIDCISHSGSPQFEYDIEAVLETAKKLNKVIEINNHTMYARKSSIENCKKIARKCAEMGVNVVLSTDAHSAYEIGDTEACWVLAMEAGISEEQIINLNADRFLRYICERRGFAREIFENTKTY